MDGIKGGNQVRDYGQGSDRQAGYLTQVRDRIEERMGDKLCHPLAEHQRRTGNLDHPVGILGFARTLCATAGYYGLPIATPFYFRHLSQQREVCEEALLSLLAEFASLDEGQRAPLKACGASAPWATAGPSREPLRRDEVGLRQKTTKNGLGCGRGSSLRNPRRPPMSLLRPSMQTLPLRWPIHPRVALLHSPQPQSKRGETAPRSGLQYRTPLLTRLIFLHMAWVPPPGRPRGHRSR